MQDQQLNQFAKYDSFSTYNTKTKERLTETRHPMEYYQKHNIETKWDKTLLQTQQPIHRELDKITNLVDTLFNKDSTQLEQSQQIREKSIIIEQNNNKSFSNFNENNNSKIQSFANLKDDLLNIQANFIVTQQQKRFQEQNVSQIIEQKGLCYRQSAALSLQDLRKVQDEEIQKALKVLQK